MPDALSRLETLATAHKYLTGAQDVLDGLRKVKAFAKKDPKNLSEAKKILGLAKDKYKPLKDFFSKTQTEVLAAAKEGFPPIPDPTSEARKRMEKIAKSKGPNSPGFEKELTIYIKLLQKYEYELRERMSYMKLVTTKCDLNIKNFTLMNQIIDGTMIALKAVFVAIPEAQTAAGSEILQIMKSGIEKHPRAVANAYKKLKATAQAHEKDVKRDQVYAKAALKKACDKKLKFVMEDAKAFFKKLF